MLFPDVCENMPLEKKIEKTLACFDVPALEGKTPKIKPYFYKILDHTLSDTNNESRARFELQYSRLYLRYKNIMRKENVSMMFDRPHWAWTVFERYGGCLILIGVNPMIGNVYLRVAPIPPDDHITIPRFKLFAEQGLPSAALLWTKATNLSSDIKIKEIIESTSVIYPYEFQIDEG